MTTPFTTFAFTTAAASATAGTRNMPDRLVDVYNVKDFGAVGDGLTDDTDGVVAAIVAAYRCDPVGDGFRAGSRVFLPAGKYQVLNSTVPEIGLGSTQYLKTSALTSSGNSVLNFTYIPTWVKNGDGIAVIYNGAGIPGGTTISSHTGNSITLSTPVTSNLAAGTIIYVHVRDPNRSWGLTIEGAGRDATIITGNCTAEAVLSKNNNAGESIGRIADLTVENTSIAAGTWGILLFYTNHCGIENLKVRGVNGVYWYYNNFMGSVRNCIFQNTNSQAGTIGLSFGQGEVLNCHADGFESGFAITSAAGIVCAANYFTNCTYGIKLYIDPNSNISQGSNFISNRFAASCSYGLWAGANVWTPGVAVANCDRSANGTVGSYAIGVLFAAHTSRAFNITSISGTPNVCLACNNVLSSGSAGRNWTFIQCWTQGVTPPIYLNYADLTSGNEGDTFNLVDAQLQNSWNGIVAGGSSTNHYKVRYDGSNWRRIG